MRVLVAEPGVVPDEGADGLEVLDDRRIRVEHLLPAVLRHRREPSGLIDGREDRKFLPLPGEEVVFAVAGRGVHESRTGVHGDVVAEDDAERARVLFGRELAPALLREGMGVDGAFERAARNERPALPVLPAELFGDARDEPFGDEVVLTSLDLDPRIGLVRVDGDREVRGDRPGRRRPGQEGGRDVLVGDPEVGRERDVDRGILPFLVLELRLGERRAVGEAPAHRLEGLVDEVLLVDAAEGPGDHGLVRVGHRRIGTVPEPADPQALELLALDADVLLGVGPAGAADLDGAHVLLLGAELLVDLLLDRQTVAIPARNVGGVEAHHRRGCGR